MKNGLFWHFAKRMLRRRRLAVGTVVFSIISAGGLAAGLVAIGPVMSLILDNGPNSNLRTAVEAQVASNGFLSSLLPTVLIELLPTDRLAGVALILAALCGLTIFGAVANGSNETFDERLYLALRQGAHEAVDRLTFVKSENCRDRLHTQLSCDLGMLVDVYFDKLDLTRGRPDGLFKDRCQLFAWAAPGCPEVDENGLFRGFSDDIDAK